jgi:hypothetical protein
MLERAGGKQACAAEKASLNRNTSRRLCRVFGVPAGRATN